jgi:hypothetical protein
MKLDEIKETLKAMYAAGPEVEHPRGLALAFVEAGEKAPSEEDIEEACEELVAEGVLQRAGRIGFEATEAFKIESGYDEDEE